MSTNRHLNVFHISMFQWASTLQHMPSLWLKQPSCDCFCDTLGSYAFCCTSTSSMRVCPRFGDATMLQTALNFWDFRIFEIRLIFCFKQADIFLIFFPFFFPPKLKSDNIPVRYWPRAFASSWFMVLVVCFAYVGYLYLLLVRTGISYLLVNVRHIWSFGGHLIIFYIHGEAGTV